MGKLEVVSIISTMGLLLAACGGATARAQQPATEAASLEPASSEPTAGEPAAGEPAAAEPVPAPPAEENEAAEGASGEVTLDSVRMVMRGKAVPMGGGFGLALTVTATTDPGKEAWLFGTRDGLNMAGSFGHIATAGVGGGSFREGGSSTSIHVKGAQAVAVKRAYPRSNEAPIEPGTTLNVTLKTSICPQNKEGSNCKSFEVAKVVLTVTASGEPTVRIKAGATP